MSKFIQNNGSVYKVDGSKFVKLYPINGFMKFNCLESLPDYLSVKRDDAEDDGDYETARRMQNLLDEIFAFEIYNIAGTPGWGMVDGKTYGRIKELAVGRSIIRDANVRAAHE